MGILFSFENPRKCYNLRVVRYANLRLLGARQKEEIKKIEAN